MFPLLAHVFRAFFLDELSFRRWIRGALFGFAGGGLTFAEQLASVLDAPHSVKAIRVVAVVAMFVGGSIQSSAAGKGEQLRELPPPRGFSLLPVVVLLFVAIAGGMILSLTSCASSSESAGAFKATGSAHGSVHDVEVGQGDEHEHATEQKTRTAAPVDTYTRKLRRDGTVAAESFSRRGPVAEQVRSELQKDARSLFGDDRQLDDLSNYESDGATATKHDFHPSIGCAAFGGAGFFIVAALAFFLWRRVKKSKLAQLAKTAAEVAGVPIP
jgi:hypothetical protein